ncbi:SPOR domain-containing protein [Acinetobacter nematophilus]|uniref:SPOR domain-containing protein n=1 Tax=Acinetobacter nematophilus TaxID=2994642 RepID=A0A9X3DX83_9GAMM|nr:SPOR domain-containing protein [Acinetobacter nematophilus]MCX5469876.1 SPOR domain-containing protein [Acinetobacter nematophilus]
MSMNNKQRWMGGVVLLSGGVLLAALLLKGKEEIHQRQAETQPAGQTQPNKTTPAGEPVQLQPLTVDVATEKRLLEEQKRAREKAVAEQEAKAAEFLRMQQQAEADAARKAAEEYAAANARRGAAAAQEGADIPPELVQDEKAKAQQKAAEQKQLEQQNAQLKQKAEAEKKLAEQKRQATAEAERKAAEEKKRKLEEQQKAEDKRKAEAEKKAAAEKKQAEEKKAEAEKKRKAEEAKKKAEAEKARDLLENGDKQWMVQVALAANEANADAVAAKLRAKGYKVTKSPTSKGIRIMVGPSKDREGADAARKKINADDSLGMKSAWVIEWVPLDRR